MKKALLIILVLVAIGLLGGGIWWLFFREETPPTPVETTTTEIVEEDTVVEEPQDITVGQATALITYTNSGFNPGTVTVKSGTTMTIKNESSGMLEFSSDPHPIHTNNGELNAATISPGQSITITVNRAGTWGFHNHLDHNATGTLIVE